MKKPTIYVAAPLFSQSELEYNDKLRNLLSSSFSVFLPQSDGGLIVEMVKAGLPREQAVRKVFETDISAIRRCDLILLLLDGRSIDEGACFELGFAFALEKLCIGLQTDVRRLLPTGNNPMIEAACFRIFESPDQIVQWSLSAEMRDLLQMTAP